MDDIAQIDRVLEEITIEREKIGLLANDLNNVLQEISGYLELIKSSSHNPDRVKAFSDTATMSTHRANLISKKLASISGQVSHQNSRIAFAPNVPGYTEPETSAPPVIRLPHMDGVFTDDEMRLRDSRPIANPTGKNPLIMVVDDEIDNCHVLEQVLCSHDYRVISAYDGFEAFSLYRLYPGQIALILLDQIMPEMTGADTFKLLKVVDPGVKAFLFSGSQEGELDHGLVDDGLLGFVQKPFTSPDLVARIGLALV